MNRNVYRICLVMMIALAAISGIYYYRTVMKREISPKDGLFVQRMTTGCEKA